MAETTTTGEKTGIEVKTGEDNAKEARQAIPLAGGALKTYDAVASGAEDGSLSGSDLNQIQSEGATFISDCAGAVTGIATDPLGWLVGQGLNFLISVVQPLQDAIHFVSGDGPALSQAAGNFDNIGKGLQKMRDDFDKELKSSLQNWGGEASEAAGTKLGEFGKGIDGVAGQAGDIASLLQTSSMIMTVIEDFIKALLTELITWLIMIWVPALAAAVPTAGASTAAATSATVPKAAGTVSRTTRQVSKLQKLLDAIKTFLTKVKTFMRKLGPEFKKAMDRTKTKVDDVTGDMAAGNKQGIVNKMYGKDGAIGSRLGVDPTTGQRHGFGDAMGNVAGQTTSNQLGNASGRNVGNLQKSGEYDQTGSEQSQAETEEQLDI